MREALKAWKNEVLDKFLNTFLETASLFIKTVNTSQPVKCC